MKIIPTELTMLIYADPVEEGKTDGGIILPDLHSEMSRLSTVLAIGNKVTRYKKGDRVIVGFMGGTDLHFPAKGVLKDTYRLITEVNVTAKVEDEDEPGLEGVNEEITDGN